MGYSIIFRDKTRTESVTKATSPGLKQDTYPTTDVSIPTDTELGTQLTSTGKIFGHWANFPCLVKTLGQNRQKRQWRAAVVVVIAAATNSEIYWSCNYWREM